MGEFTPTPERERVLVSSLRSVKDSYDRIRRVLSTRVAEGFDAVDKSSREPVLLWLLRFPFAVGSDEAQYYIRRMTAISQIEASIPTIRSFGVDSGGQAYLVCDHVSGKAPTHANVPDPEALFSKILRAAARLHRAGWHLGDVSEDSFLLTESGEIKIVGLMGHFDSGARKTAVLPPIETLHFLAPEQRGGGIADTVTDVYAFGVYGYRLFTGRYLVPDRPTDVRAPASIAPAPSLICRQPPPWLDYVLGEALQTDREKRFRDATHLLDTIQGIRERGGRVPSSTVWSRSTMLVNTQDIARARKAPSVVTPVESEVMREISVPEPAPVRFDWAAKVLPAATWMAAIAIGIGVAVAIFMNLERAGPESPATPPRLERQPIAPDGVRQLKATLVQATNTELPIGERVAAFERGYALDPAIALRLLGAAAIEEDQERLTQLLREWVAQRAPGRVRSDAGPGALIFSDPGLSAVAEEQLSRTVSSFSLGDAQEVLLGLLERGDRKLRSVAQEILAARLLSPFRSVFLDAYLRERPEGVNEDVKRALIRGSVGIFSEDDVVTIKRWTSPSAEAALLAACATVPDPSVALDALMCSERSLQLEPGASLVAWLQNKLWDDRSQLMRSIGVLALIDAAPEDEISAAFEKLKPYASRGLMKAFLVSGHPKLVSRGIEYFADRVTPREVLPLLGHEEKQVRMSAVRALKGLNDLEILQGVLRAYELERDEEVRLLYQEVHWVVLRRN